MECNNIKPLETTNVTTHLCNYNDLQNLIDTYFGTYCFNIAINETASSGLSINVDVQPDQTMSKAEILEIVDTYKRKYAKDERIWLDLVEVLNFLSRENLVPVGHLTVQIYW